MGCGLHLAQQRLDLERKKHLRQHLKRLPLEAIPKLTLHIEVPYKIGSYEGGNWKRVPAPAERNRDRRESRLCPDEAGCTEYAHAHAAHPLQPAVTPGAL